MKKSNVMVGGGKATASKAAASKAAGNNNAIQVMVFENPEFGRVRTMVDENGEPLFCGKDVCEALGYTRADNAIRQHVNTLDALKRCIKVPGSYRKDGSRTSRSQLMLFVTESGLYSLVFGSKLDSAQRFKLWVTSVVLPQIRKTGGYIPLHEGESDEEVWKRTEEILRRTLEEKEQLLAQQEKLLHEQGAKFADLQRQFHEQGSKFADLQRQFDTQGVNLEIKTKLVAEQGDRIRQLDQQVDAQVVKIQKAAEEIVDLEHDIDRLLPKALYTDNVLDSISCYTTTQVAKELGVTTQELNRALCGMHVQYYQSGQYMLYADYAHCGFAKSRTHWGYSANGRHVQTRTYLVWTERGREFIHRLKLQIYKLQSL